MILQRPLSLIFTKYINAQKNIYLGLNWMFAEVDKRLHRIDGTLTEFYEVHIGY